MAFYSIPGVNLQVMPGSFEQLTVTNAVKTLTATKYYTRTLPAVQANGTGGAQAYTTTIAEQALITVNAQPIRWTIDGTAATASVGHPAVAGDIIMLDGINAIQNFKAFRSGGVDSTIDITYFSN
jgi:hypothetical protein